METDTGSPHFAEFVRVVTGRSLMRRGEDGDLFEGGGGLLDVVEGQHPKCGAVSKCTLPNH
jgi:hypothetical protein